MQRPHTLPALLLLRSLLLPATGLAAEPSPPPPVEQIVVVADKVERPLSRVAAQVTTFDRDRLDREQVRDLGDIARYEPALEADFTAPRFGATGLSIRGIGGNRVALELDGVPLPTQFDVGNFADSGRLALDPAILDRIEVLRGPASSLYGSDAIGGVVAITTLDADDLVAPDRSVHVGGGGGYLSATHGTLARATGAWRGTRDGILLSAVQRRGTEPDNESHGVADDLLEHEQWQGFAKWTHDAGSAGIFHLSGDVFLRQTDSDLRSLLGWERFATTEHLRGDDEQQRGRVAVEHRLAANEWLDYGSLLFYVQHNRTEQRTDELRTNGDVPVRIERNFFFEEFDAGTELRTRRDFRSGPLDHVAVTGLEWDRQAFEQRRDGRQTTLSTGATSKTLLGEVFPLRDLPQSTNDAVGVYLQDEISLGMFSFVPGVRWDGFWIDARTDELVTDPGRVTDKKDDRWTWRAAITARPLHALTLYGSWAQGFRAPPPEDVNLLLSLPQFHVVALPNPDLRAETSDNFELGLRWRGAALTTEAAAYYSRYDDFIESRARIGTDPATGTILFQSRNIDRATIYGVEFHSELGLEAFDRRLRAWSLDAGLHWAEGENDRSGEPLNTVAPLKFVGGLLWRSPRFGLESGLRVTHLAEKPDVDRTTSDVFVPPAATVLDWTTRWMPTDNVDIVVGLYNLTDERYWRYPDVRHYEPGDPRIEIASRPGFHGDVTFNFRF